MEITARDFNSGPMAPAVTPGTGVLPVVGLGTWQRLEAAATAGQDRKLLDAAIAAGIRLVDTSPMYGDAERLLAEGLGAKRDQVIIADKI